ncbi:MAG: hypothetical protein LBC68_15335 [Prevotellaceae bacterium]|jgi:hypothetical protein|nr:hypothetical protein [Prevotellaceae bacterium]
MVNIKIVNRRCPVRDRMSVAPCKHSAAQGIDNAVCMSRELPTVFYVIDTASRESLGCDYVSPRFCP